MSDLISRSKLLKEIETWGGCVEALHEYIQNMPTAYDIDKVVEELNELDVKAITRYKNGNFGNFDGVEYYIKKRKAIEIVKQGCVSDDVCEWKFEETNGIAWHCDDKCTTYNQVYIKDLKITLEDFECRCPYCGKKIKVVER